jgi:hypothetical protein
MSFIIPEIGANWMTEPWQQKKINGGSRIRVLHRTLTPQEHRAGRGFYHTQPSRGTWWSAQKMMSHTVLLHLENTM